MDSSDFDGQARQHLSTYRGFIYFGIGSIVVAAVVLVLMAVFLL